MPSHPALIAWFAMRAGKYRLLQPRPTDRPKITIVGPDPIRVLVCGAGMAAGYGVTRFEDTLAGPLARHLAESTGRGVVVDVRSAALLPAHAAIDHIGLNGAHTYRLAVFAPCYLEASFAPGAGMPRHGPGIQQHLLDTGGPAVQVAMIGIPRPSHFSRLDLVAAEAASITNRALRHTADRTPRAHYVEPPPFTSVRTARPFDEAYYRLLGALVAAQLLPTLTGTATDGAGR